MIDPWGKVLLDMGTDGPSIETVEIDLQLIDEVKRKMPIEEHRRTDLYRLHPSNSLQRGSIIYSFFLLPMTRSFCFVFINI